MIFFGLEVTLIDRSGTPDSGRASSRIAAEREGPLMAGAPASGLNTVRLGRFLNHFCERYRNADEGEKGLNLTVLVE